MWEKYVLTQIWPLSNKFHRDKKELDTEGFMFFLTGGVGLENKLENPDSTWLSDKSWDEICRMCDLPGYKGFR